MSTMVKGIQYSLLALMFFSVILVLWNIEYVTFQTTNYSRLNYHWTTTSDILSSSKGNASSVDLDILYIPKIRIQFTSKNINGSATADNVKLIKGNTKTNLNIIKGPHPPPSHVNNTLLKLNNSHSPAKESLVTTETPQTRVDDLPVTTETPQKRVNDLSVTTETPQTRVDDLSVTTETPQKRVDVLPVTTETPQTRVDDLIVTTETQQTRVDDLSVKTETPQTRVDDLIVTTDNQPKRVNDLSKTTSKPTSRVNRTMVKVDKPTSRANDSSVKLDKPRVNNTSKVNVEDSPKDQWTKFRYPLDVDMVELVRKLKSNIPVAHKPIFPYSYNFTHHRIAKCMSGTPFFIFLIKSAVANDENRAAIRETWAHSKLQKKYNFIRIFLVGSSDKKSVMSAIKTESSKYNDIVRMSFLDNYYNNTLKTTGAIHWTVQHCNRAKFVVFVDDDMLVSIKSLYSFIHTKVTGPTYFGGHIDVQYPQRQKGDKWYVSNQDYPYAIYPPMPSGGFLIMTMNFVIDLHFATQYTRRFIYDDVYLAILAYKLRVRPVNIPKVYVTPIRLDNGLLQNSLAVHGFDPSALRLTWKLFKRSFVHRSNMA
ncbi:uncharacterized protein LOC110453864 [Mizuhopecten yessoensis]|uniref:uncharacterized protein LOC110453864 n=1 Tax=Mizuhopecten yessoensis TaxID=6573 RepID=UPI000B457A5A|nr:uncharacterized protein LOC110453864 [Mizuhopecten yessoensis]